MKGRWDIENYANASVRDKWDAFKRLKGERTQDRLNILKQITFAVVRERPDLKTQPGRLCSAVFAKLKRDGGFIVVGFRKAKGPPNQRYTYTKVGIWNEKEFFYHGNYHWTRADIIKFANEKQTLLWLKIVAVILGVLLIRKLLK